MGRARLAWIPLALLSAGCAGGPGRDTLAELRQVEPDVREVRVEDGLERAMAGYQSFLEETPESSLTPEAIRRLADLKIEQEFGLLGEGGPVEASAEPPEAASGPGEASGDPGEGRPAREALTPPATARASAPRERSRASGIADHSESHQAFESRATGDGAFDAAPGPPGELSLPEAAGEAPAGPLEAIALYDRILREYPHYQHNDQVLYQKARAYDELGRPDEAIEVMESLIDEYPGSRFLAEVQFRRGEYFFMRKRYYPAELAYAAVAEIGSESEYYELALYKLGWAFYKQLFHEEALQAYTRLLDHKVSTGYDFDQTENEADERRISDTFRVISLCFSNLGGPEVVQAFFEKNGQRSYESRIYSHHGEFYLEKLRYQDAAAIYRAFVDIYPLHEVAPHFSMRVVEIYEAGGFPKLVLDAKKTFAATYGLQAEYWRHFDVETRPEVRSYLKSNLSDLANHYHALYQQGGPQEERPAHFAEALRWYRAYLDSFPADAESPAVHYQLADLLLEHEDFGDAAHEYERIAYDYGSHEQASAAGYAAIYAHREEQKRSQGEQERAVRRDAVSSTLRFVDVFPEHEHAATVLGAAVDDLYEMEDFGQAIAVGQQLLEAYPEAELEIRRSAWAVVAHASLEIGDYTQAERAYQQVLSSTPADDPSRQTVVENLAASIYKQGEEAGEAGDHRAAAGHFLRIARVAPSAEIRGAAEYDAAAALIRLEDWTGAAEVLEDFREAHPEHELQGEATKQIAFVYREQGDLARAASEYEDIAATAEDPELQREAWLIAGGLYEDAAETAKALAAYQAYVERFPEPLEAAVEMRFKIAEMHGAAGDGEARRQELRRIVRTEAGAGEARTPRVRYLAARSALVLAGASFDAFREVELVQPFQRSLREKKRRMDASLATFGDLLDYEVGEVTAGATFYMAEIYSDFSRSLMDSERPAGLSPAELLDYELVLEEEAFPFEEKAIAVHEKNLELMAAGLWNEWIARSLEQLAGFVPGRYAKLESSPGFIGSLESYAYRTPRTSRPEATDPASAEELSAEEPLPAAPATAEPAAKEEPAAEAPLPAAPEPAAALEGAL